MSHWKSKLTENYKNLSQEIQQLCQQFSRDPASLKLIWVSKTNPLEAVEAATEVGIEQGLTQVDFGENKVQECVDKFSEPHPQRVLHLIGPLQSNKIRKAIQTSQWIHTVSSKKHLAAIERIAAEEEKSISVLFQVNTSGEVSKSGLEPSELSGFLSELPASEWVTYRGLMTIGPNTGVPEDSREGFQFLRAQRDNWCQFDERFTEFNELSMGMSQDLAIAIEEGSTLVRVGTALFGARDYSN